MEASNEIRVIGAVAAKDDKDEPTTSEPCLEITKEKFVKSDMDEELNTLLNNFKKEMSQAKAQMPQPVPLITKILNFIKSNTMNEDAQYLKAHREDFSALKLGGRWNVPSSWHSNPRKGLVVQNKHSHLYSIDNKTIALWKLGNESPALIRSYSLNETVVSVHGIDMTQDALELHGVDFALIAVSKQSLVLLGSADSTERDLLRKLDEQKVVGATSVISSSNKTFIATLSGDIFLYESALTINWMSWSYFDLTIFTTVGAPIQLLRVSEDGKLLLVVSGAHITIYLIENDQKEPIFKIQQAELVQAGCSAIIDVQALVTDERDIYILTLTSNSLKRFLLTINLAAKTDSKSMMSTATVREPPKNSPSAICKILSHSSGVTVVQSTNKVLVATSKGIFDYDVNWKETLETLKIHGGVIDVEICVTYSSSNSQNKTDILVVTDDVVFSYILVSSSELLSATLIDDDLPQQAGIVLALMPEALVRDHCLQLITIDSDNKKTKTRAIDLFNEGSDKDKRLSILYYVCQLVFLQPEEIVASVTIVENRLQVMYTSELEGMQKKLKNICNSLDSLLIREGLKDVKEFISFCDQVVCLLQILKCESILISSPEPQLCDIVIKKKDLFSMLPCYLATSVAKKINRTFRSLLKFVENLSNQCPMLFDAAKSSAIQGSYCLREAISEKFDFSQKARLLQQAQKFFESTEAKFIDREPLVKELIELGAIHSLAQIYIKLITREENPGMVAILWSEVETLMFDLQHRLEQPSGENYYLSLLHVLLKDSNAPLRSNIYQHLYQTSNLKVIETASNDLLKGLQQFLLIRLRDKTQAADSDISLSAVISLHKLQARPPREKERVQRALKTLLGHATTTLPCNLPARQNLLSLASKFVAENPTSHCTEYDKLKARSKLLEVQVQLLVEAEELRLLHDDAELNHMRIRLGNSDMLKRLALRLRMPKTILRMHLMEGKSCSKETAKIVWKIVSERLERLSFDDAREYLKHFATEFIKRKNCLNLMDCIELLESICASKGGDHAQVHKMFVSVAGLFLTTKAYEGLITEATKWSHTTEAFVRSALLLSQLLTQTGQPTYSKSLVKKSIAMMERVGVDHDQFLYFELSMMQGRKVDA